MQYPSKRSKSNSLRESFDYYSLNTFRKTRFVLRYEIIGSFGLSEGIFKTKKQYHSIKIVLPICLKLTIFTGAGRPAQAKEK